MYKITKDAGHNKNVILVNTETNASMVIGRLTISILSTLEEKESIEFGTGEGKVSAINVWDIPVSDETAKALSKSVMPIEKPIRDQSKKSEQSLNPRAIDALDLLLGIVDYK